MTNNFFLHIKKLNELALVLHQHKKQATQYTFSSLKEHVDEVKMLLDEQQEHWKAETVDILIHAWMLLDRYDIDEKVIAELVEKRLFRFEEKIKTAIKEKKA